MEPRVAAVSAGSGTTAQWRRVQPIGGPLDGAPAGLVAHGARLGEAVATPTGIRRRLVVPAGATVDFGAYASAFPAAQWRERVGARQVRLRVRVSAPALLTVQHSDARGGVVAGEQRLLAARADEVVDIEIGEIGGLVWFTLQAGLAAAELIDGGWEVGEEPRPGGLVLGTPTIGRVDDLVANLRRIAQSPALLAVVQRIVLVDHAPVPIADAIDTAVGDLGGVLRVVRQPNLGGSGGYSRVMHEAAAEPGAQAVLLLDDDILVEPAALLTAFEFGRRTLGGDLVGLQMLDADRPGILEAAAERITDGSFWWTGADPAIAGTDVAVPLRDLPNLHAPHAADFAGWWGALIPLDVVRAVGYAMPLFLKWDDAEYALRARAAGFRTVSLQGAAVWHASWRIKDDASTWPAFFHARNRLVAALLHAPVAVRTGVLAASLAVEVKQLLALRTFAVERRQEGVRAVLSGPAALASDDLTRLLSSAATAADQHRLPTAEVAAVPEPRRILAARRAPRGAGLAVWTAAAIARHLLVPVRERPLRRLPADRAGWWVLPVFDDVLVPTSDGTAHIRLRRDPARFRALLSESVRLHTRLWFAWPGLRRRYRAASAELAAPAAWEARFASVA